MGNHIFATAKLVILKTKVLLVWWYDRNDLIAPFIKMKDDIEFTCLFYRFKEQENLSFEMPFPRIYWTDYSTPQQLLNAIKPDKVVFMGIENFLTFGLNIAAKNKNIPTYYLFHGLNFNSVEERVNLGLDSLENKLENVVDIRYFEKNIFYTKQKYHSILFFFYALLHYKCILNCLPIIKFLIDYKNMSNRLVFLTTNKEEFRLPSHYILMSKAASNYFVERDGIDESRMMFIGPYMSDEMYGNYEGISTIPYKYILLIDQNIALFDISEKNEIISKLRLRAAELQLKLLVKVHPADLHADKIFHNDDVILVKSNSNIKEMIYKAEYIVGYDSALLLPAIVKNKVTCIKINEKRKMADLWHKYKVVGLISKESIFQGESFDFFEPKQEDVDYFVEEYLGFADGNSIQRLKLILCKKL